MSCLRNWLFCKVCELQMPFRDSETMSSPCFDVFVFFCLRSQFYVHVWNLSNWMTLTFLSSFFSSATGSAGKSGDEVYVVAKYDYVAQGSQELDLRKNEKLILLDDSKHWWKVSCFVVQTDAEFIDCTCDISLRNQLIYELISLQIATKFPKSNFLPIRFHFIAY